MNLVKKTFVVSIILSVALIVVGLILLLVTGEFSAFNAVPILAGAYMSCMAVYQYRRTKGLEMTEYEMKLETVEKSGLGFMEEYHFVGTKDNEPVEYFLAGRPKLQDNAGKPLRPGAYYKLIYLVSPDSEEDEAPYAIIKMKGFVRKEGE